jgi:hypothetical protein
MNAGDQFNAKTTAIAANLARLLNLPTNAARRPTSLPGARNATTPQAQRSTSIPPWTTPGHCMVRSWCGIAQKCFRVRVGARRLALDATRPAPVERCAFAGNRTDKCPSML